MPNTKQTFSDMESLKPCLPSASASPSDISDPEVYRREYPPAHYTLKITSFSLLAETKVEKYDSGIFEAGGFKWRLSVYPNGDKKKNGAGHLSLYLAIEETDKLKHGWEVNAIFKLFVFDQTRNMYLTIQDADGPVRRFHELKTEWGFSQLMSLETFKEASNGYLIDDTCVFGAEVFVVKPSGKWELLAMVKPPPRNNKYTWKIENFSKKNKDVYFSDPVTIGSNNWKLQVYPKGFKEESGKCLSVYLALVGAAELPPKRKMYAEYKLRLLDQLNTNHHEKKLGHWFDSVSTSYGFPAFLQLEDLHKPAKGFTYNDTVIVEVEILVMSEVKMMSAAA